MLLFVFNLCDLPDVVEQRIHSFVQFAAHKKHAVCNWFSWHLSVIRGCQLSQFCWDYLEICLTHTMSHVPMKYPRIPCKCTAVRSQISTFWWNFCTKREQTTLAACHVNLISALSRLYYPQLSCIILTLQSECKNDKKLSYRATRCL